MANVTNSVWQGCRNGAWMALCFFSFSSLPSRCEQKLEIINKIPHTGYSEGLDFHAGFLWHALPKQILKIDPKDGSILEKFSPATDYSESIKWLNGKLWNLSFSDEGLYQGELTNNKLVFTKITSVPEPRGWGIEKVGNQLAVTGNFSNKIYFFEPKTKKWGKTLVTDATDLEDLAWDGSRLWSSSFSSHSGKIFYVDLKSGKMSSLYELPEKDLCPIIDGIAFDGKTLWITGKECPSIYQAKLPK